MRWRVCPVAAAFLVLIVNLRYLLPKRPPPTLTSRPVDAAPPVQTRTAPPALTLEAGRLQVVMDAQSGSFVVKTSRGSPVATSDARPYVRANGGIRRLVLASAPARGAGCDSLGCFAAATLEWRSTELASSVMTTTVRAYAVLGVIVFSQRFPRALAGTSSGLPCGFISGPASGLFNDCGLASAFPRLSLSGTYRHWLSWTGGGNSPEPSFGSLDAMVSHASFLKEDAGQGGATGGRVARGLLTIEYEGAARVERTVQQELEAISLTPPWGNGATVSFSRAKAFCSGERRCRGFTWQAPPRSGNDAAVEPAPDALGRWRFVTDTPADGKGRVPLAFYASSAATNLGGLVAGPIVLPNGRSLNDTVALTPLSSFMSSSHEYDVATGTLDLGILGSISDLAAGFTSEWLLALDDGFNGALRKAGAAVLQRAGTASAKRAHAAADVSLNSLGYATQQVCQCVCALCVSGGLTRRTEWCATPHGAPSHAPRRERGTITILRLRKGQALWGTTRFGARQVRRPAAQQNRRRVCGVSATPQPVRSGVPSTCPTRRRSSAAHIVRRSSRSNAGRTRCRSRTDGG